MSGRSRGIRRPAGWTLLELAVVLGLLTLLSSLTLPSFLAQQREGRRSEALGLLMEIELRQTQWHALNGSYSANLGSAELALDPHNSHSLQLQAPSGRYRIELHAVGSEGYQLRAIAQGSQDADLPCRLLVLEQAALQTRRLAGPAPEALLDATSSPGARRCWKL